MIWLPLVCVKWRLLPWMPLLRLASIDSVSLGRAHAGTSDQQQEAGDQQQEASSHRGTMGLSRTERA